MKQSSCMETVVASPSCKGQTRPLCAVFPISGKKSKNNKNDCIELRSFKLDYVPITVSTYRGSGKRGSRCPWSEGSAEWRWVRDKCGRDVPRKGKSCGSSRCQHLSAPIPRGPAWPRVQRTREVSCRSWTGCWPSHSWLCWTHTVLQLPCLTPAHNKSLIFSTDFYSN